MAKPSAVYVFALIFGRTQAGPQSRWPSTGHFASFDEKKKKGFEGAFARPVRALANAAKVH
jgi:hypothetical protein